MYIVKRNNNDLFNLFDDLFNTTKVENFMFTDIFEDDNKYTLNIEVPGFNKDDIKLSLEDGYLTVEASHEENNVEENQETKYLLQERYNGKFSRSYYVGDVHEEKINANLNNGILTITINKVSEEENKKYITIE